MRRAQPEILSCSCGATFTTMVGEARHRHNFPSLCRRPAPRVRCTACGWKSRRNPLNNNPCPHCDGAVKEAQK